MKRSRGSVMVHVLVTAVVVSVIAAGLMKMLLSRYQIQNRVAESAQNTAQARGSFMRLMSAWNAQGGAVCATVAGSGYSCTGVAGTCNCTCTPTSSSDAKVMACVSGGVCVIRSCSTGGGSCTCP